MEEYDCEMMGEELYDLAGEPLACRWCRGIRYDEELGLRILYSTQMVSPPRRPEKKLRIKGKPHHPRPSRPEVVPMPGPPGTPPEIPVAMFNCPATNPSVLKRWIKEKRVWRRK